MEFISTPIAGCYEINLRPISDERGFFFRQFCANEFASASINFKPVQSNFSMTNKAGTIRGLHYQVPPKSEAKFLRTVRGRAFDVCVDLRVGSSTFAQWHAIELDDQKHNAIFIPKGCAHGFQTLTNHVEMMYFHDEFYSKEHDRTALYSDVLFGVTWPLPIAVISDKDKNALPFPAGFKGLEL